MIIILFWFNVTSRFSCNLGTQGRPLTGGETGARVGGGRAKAPSGADSR